MEQKLATATRSAWRDNNPAETQEWLECFDVLDEGGPGRGQELLRALTARTRRAGIRRDSLLNTLTARTGSCLRSSSPSRLNLVSYRRVAANE